MSSQRSWSMKTRPPTVTAALLLMALTAAFWFGFAVLTACGVIRSIPAGWVRWIMAALALGTSAVLAGLAVLLRRRYRPAYYAAALLLAIIAVLSITDDFGLWDLFSLLICLAALALLLKDRAWYLGPGGDRRG